MFIELVLDKKIATIIIKNKNKKNSLTKDFFIELKESLEKISNNENIRVLILKGDGDNFSSGVNLNELIQFPSTIDARDFALLMESTFNKLFNLRIPTISVVDGFALGAGAGLVLNTDISIFTPNVKLGFPAVRIGAILPSACTKRLVATTGMKVAKDLLLTGKLIDSNEALRVNIASYVIEKENVNSFIEKTVKQVSKGSPLALEITKNTINNYVNTGNNPYSEDNFAFLYSTSDWHQRIWNFLNKDK